MYRKAIELAGLGAPFVLASVVKAWGSTPQKAGAQAVFEPGGKVWGTLGGGCLEAEARGRALNALDTGAPAVFDLRLDDDYGWDDGLICGGKARIWLDPDVRKNLTAYRAALEALGRRERGVLLTHISRDSAVPGKVEWVPENAIQCAAASVDAELLADVLRHDRYAHRVDSSGEYYIEPVSPPPRLIIAGGGHVGKAVAHQAARLGFDITVIDDRPQFADAKLFPESASTICGDIALELERLPIDDDTFVLIVTRGHRHDGIVLKACIHRPAAYIGMIGSRRKSSIIRKGFLDEGIATADEFDRIYAPVGLDIGAVTVDEIATSICAELVSVRRGKSAAAHHLRDTRRAIQ